MCHVGVSLISSLSPVLFIVSLYVCFAIFLLYIVGLIVGKNIIPNVFGKSSHSNRRSDGSHINPYPMEKRDTNSGGGTSSGISDWMSSFLPEATPDLKIDRAELDTGRCDDVENVTSGNNCNNTKPKENIVWKLQIQKYHDYNLLPPELKEKNSDLTEISIPFKQFEGTYIPDCNASFYTATGEKTGLLRNDKKLGSCKFVKTPGVSYDK